MKRLFLLCLILLTLVFPVSADILWEPLDNQYYNTHMNNMTTIAAAYVVPEDLTVNLYTAPTNGRLIKTMEPGTRMYVGFSTQVNGEIWATGYAYGDWENEGWFRHGRLQREYCHDDFVRDFADSITSDTAVLDSAAVPAKELNGDVPTWIWPGSGIADGTLSFDGSDRGYNDGLLTFSRIYTDPDGGRWGYIGYYMGHCGWAYLDDLYAADPALHLSPQAENTVTDTAPEEAAPGNSMLWIAIPVASLMIVTVILIAVLRKKCKRASS